MGSYFVGAIIFAGLGFIFINIVSVMLIGITVLAIPTLILPGTLGFAFEIEQRFIFVVTSNITMS